MTTRQDAIEALKNLEDWEANKAILEAYLEAPIPDAELWENREHIAGLLGPMEGPKGNGVYFRPNILGRAEVEASTPEEVDKWLRSWGERYRFVDGPVTLAPKSKGKLGPWIEGIEGGWWLREGGGGSVAFVCLSINGRFRRSQGPSFYTFIEAQAAEDKWLMEQGWELEGGPVVVEPREEPKKEAGEKALAEEVNEVKTVLCWLSDRVSDTTRPIPTSVMDDLRAKVEELERHEQIQHEEILKHKDRFEPLERLAFEDMRLEKLEELVHTLWVHQTSQSTKIDKLTEDLHLYLNAPSTGVVEALHERVEKLENAHQEVIFLEGPPVARLDYETLKSQLLADADFRKEILLKLCGAWRLSVDKDYIFRDNTPASIAILQLGYQAQFGSNSYWFADLSSAKSWCDEQLRAAGYLLEDESK